MSTVKVQQVLRRYHLKPSERDFQQRLNQLTEMFLRGQLDTVLTESGFAPSELVCIKKLSLAIDYDDNKSDFEISELWRKALLKSIYQQLGNANRDDLIRYPSEIEAIKSVARSLAFGLINHHWAWRQLGIIDGKNADLKRVKEQWVAYLTRHPHLLLPVFKGLMSEGTFIKLLERKILRSDELILLTDTATQFLNLKIKWRAISEQKNPLQARGSGRKNKILSTRTTSFSELVSALLQNLHSTFGLNYGLAQADDSSSEQAESKSAVVKLLFWAVIAPRPHALNAVSGATQAIEKKLSDLWLMLNLEQVILPHSKQGEFNSTGNLNLPEKQNFIPESEVKVGKEFYSDDELIFGDPTSKKSLFSQFGGLLFLLNRLEQENVLQQLHDPKIEHHSLLWRLENFCWLLLPECKGDASVEVFSGRVFEKLHQGERCVAMNDEEIRLLSDIAEQFKQKIVTTLKSYSRSAMPSGNLFAKMCQRKARIEAQPGWVNIFYELDSVDTAVRAAGLDINPDFLPWLACVVKFYYE